MHHEVQIGVFTAEQCPGLIAGAHPKRYASDQTQRNVEGRRLSDEATALFDLAHIEPGHIILYSGGISWNTFENDCAAPPRRRTSQTAKYQTIAMIGAEKASIIDLGPTVPLNPVWIAV